MEIFNIVFIVISALIVLTIIPIVLKSTKKRIDQARESLTNNGYVVEDSYFRPIGAMTRVWGKLQAPTSFYIQLSTLDPVQTIAGNLGIADIKIGDPHFDSKYVIRSNFEEGARNLLSNDVKNFLLSFKELRFRTGSIDSLLGADYFPEIKLDRNIRSIWMIETAGKQTEVEIVKLLELGQQLSNLVKKFAKTGAADKGEFYTGFFEGR